MRAPIKTLSHILLAIAVSAAVIALLSAFLGRLLFLSSQAEVIRLGAIKLFAVSSAIWITLILAIRRKG
jgi:hypothetical protein